MPAPLAVDREAVRVLVIAVGAREAARRMGLSEDAVRQWCTRGKWLADTKPRQALPLSQQPVATVAKTAALALSDALADDSKQTRLGFSRAYRKAAAHVSELPGSDVVTNAQDIKALAQGAALVHGWDAGQVRPTHVQINLLGGAYGEKAAQASEPEQPTIDIE